MYRVETTATFDAWLDNLRDQRAKARIAQRLVRIEAGLLGDWKSIGDGVSELRIDYGPGYRLYVTFRKQIVVILLTGSDKGDQKAAISAAKKLATQV